MQLTTNQRQSARLLEIDLLKGSLVFLVIVYHATYAFHRAGTGVALGDAITGQLNFLHSAFVGITGFLCGYHYYPKYLSDPVNVRRRLFARGVKLYALMILGNVCFYVLGLGMSYQALRQEINSVQDALTKLVLSPVGSLVAYEILSYIAILLLIIAIVIKPLLAVLTVCLLVILNSFVDWTLAHFLLIGILCHLVGIWAATSGKNPRIWFPNRASAITAILVFAISRFLMPILFMKFASNNSRVLVTLLDTVMWFAALLGLFQLCNWPTLKQNVIFFGQYTLIAYILQMVVIRCVATGIGNLVRPVWLLYLTVVIVTTLVLCLMLRTIRLVREKSLFFDQVYRFSFQ